MKRTESITVLIVSAIVATKGVVMSAYSDWKCGALSDDEYKSIASVRIQTKKNTAALTAITEIVATQKNIIVP